MNKTNQTITYDDFSKVDMRVGKIIEVNDFPEARKPAYKVKVDLGSEIGIKQSSVQCTNHSKEELLGRQVICVVNFPVKQIGPTKSEVLVMGVDTEHDGITLLMPGKNAKLGNKVY